MIVSPRPLILVVGSVADLLSVASLKSGNDTAENRLGNQSSDTYVCRSASAVTALTALQWQARANSVLLDMVSGHLAAHEVGGAITVPQKISLSKID